MVQSSASFYEFMQTLMYSIDSEYWFAKQKVGNQKIGLLIKFNISVLDFFVKKQKIIQV